MKKIFLDTLKDIWWMLIIMIVFIGLNMYLLTIPSDITGKIVDLLYNIELNRNQILQLLIKLVIVSIVLLVVRVVWKYYDTCAPRSLERNIRSKLFAHMMATKIEVINERKNGEIMSYFIKDVNEIRSGARIIMSFGLRVIFTCVFTGVAMASKVNLKLTLITLFPLVITLFIVLYLKSKLGNAYVKSQQKFTSLSEYIQESTDAIRTTKAYTQEESQIDGFIELNKRVKKSNILVNLYSSLLSISAKLGFGISYGLSILFGGKMVLNGYISVGDFVAFNSYITLFVPIIDFIPIIVGRIKRVQLSYKRLKEVFEIEEETSHNLLEDKQYNNLKGDIVIRDLTFNYPGFIDNALKDINIKINEGETIGIIGKVGSGKTTLMNLLVKLYKVPRGKIIIAGRDINDISIRELRENICYITQDNFLFSTSLKENIKLFRDIYSDEDIEESTKKAMIYDEISKMRDGIDTIIGEMGVDLSGGQKQRVVISRAFLNKSNIVIFDDTFSALDNKTEQKVLKNIKELVKGKTCIIVSNRISDIKHADKILVIDNGEIIEKGNHKTLLNKKGNYYNFYKQQAIKTKKEI